jgi:hypothetical protein
MSGPYRRIDNEVQDEEDDYVSSDQAAYLGDGNDDDSDLDDMGNSTGNYHQQQEQRQRQQQQDSKKNKRPRGASASEFELAIAMVFSLGLLRRLLQKNTGTADGANSNDAAVGGTITDENMLPVGDQTQLLVSSISLFIIIFHLFCRILL